MDQAQGDWLPVASGVLHFSGKDIVSYPHESFIFKSSRHCFPNVLAWLHRYRWPETTLQLPVMQLPFLSGLYRKNIICTHCRHNCSWTKLADAACIDAPGVGPGRFSTAGQEKNRSRGPAYRYPGGPSNTSNTSMTRPCPDRIRQ